MKTLTEIYNELVFEGKIKNSYKGVNEYSTDVRTSKIWISPKGEVITLPSGTWHHNYIEQNAKKFRIKIKHKGEDVRLDGLSAGWVRVNYDRISGDMVIEALSKYFSQTIKDAIFGILKKNLNDLNLVSITLFDDSFNVVRQASSNMYMYDGEEKMEHVPFITESIKRAYDKDYLNSIITKSVSKI